MKYRSSTSLNNLWYIYGHGGEEHSNMYICISKNISFSNLVQSNPVHVESKRTVDGYYSRSNIPSAPDLCPVLSLSLHSDVILFRPIEIMFTKLLCLYPYQLNTPRSGPIKFMVITS